MLRYIIELAEGLEHLHRFRTLHRDVKPSNIFIDATGSLKLGDLGFGRTLSMNAIGTKSLHVGTPLYYAP